ncbi:MAG: GNAT family N-acetyltransferase [Gammaproteobacteria bacterium]|nr:GNAT family N-acetyltransferase [Gammaproteobacteria bacterium]
MTIKKLTPDAFIIVRKLFHTNDTNLPTAYGVIEGLVPGQIWVDTENDPQACLILCEDSYCLTAGHLNEVLFQEFFVLLKQKCNVRLQCGLSVNYKPLKLLNFTSIPRREYKYDMSALVIPHYENQTPYILKPIKDKAMFNLCIWKKIMLETYLTPENYLKNAIGFVLWDADKQIVVSEAHGICSKHLVELVTVTHEKYRGQKLSTIVCNHLIHHAVSKGLHPVWSCNESNVASSRVAEHQGMKEITKYTFYCLSHKSTCIFSACLRVIFQTCLQITRM